MSDGFVGHSSERAILVRLPRSLYDLIVSNARAEERSLSAYTRRLIAAAVKRVCAK